MNDNEIKLSWHNAMEQAGMTGATWFSKAVACLKEENEGTFIVADAIELAKVMAMDFHSTTMGIKMQEIRDAVYSIEVRSAE